jgi:hypothetical protein
MSPKPSAALVSCCALIAVASMTVAVYFAGTGRLRFAMMGTVMFVLFGGLTFELARRRSV